MGINFSFRGYITGANIKSMYDLRNGGEIDVSQKSDAEKVKMLQSGEYSIALGDYLYESQDSEIESYDFEEQIV